MTAQAEAPAPVRSTEDFLLQDRQKDLLRFTTAGSVDDGKSTLIGRLLYDSRGAYEDQIAAVRNSTLNRSTGPIDFSLLTDGLRAEREQGITIDVAYRYFATARRKFIIADTPGHEQYTRNMATGASTADLAVVLIDASKGVLPQSRRHAFIAALLGIPRIVVAVNKMDLAGYRAEVFEKVRAEFGGHLQRLGITDARFIPISALEGDNVTGRSARMRWYEGESLLEHLENVPLGSRAAGRAVRFPVQYVIRPDAGFRGYAGQVVSGALRPGDEILALPSGRASRIKSIVTWNGGLAAASPPMAVTVCLEHELDVSRGDMLVHPADVPQVSRHFEATLVWMSEVPLALDRAYVLKHTNQQLAATVKTLRHRVDVNTLVEQKEIDTLELNDVGGVTVETSRPIFFDPYRVNRSTGSFILIDPISNETVAAGMIEAARHVRNPKLQASAASPDLRFESIRLTAAERLARAGHRPATVWLTARQELAYLLERRLFNAGCQVHVVTDDVESRIVPDAAALLNAAGVIAIVSVSGSREAESSRAEARSGHGRFFSFEPHALPASDEEAAAQILAALRNSGVLTSNIFGEGEGI